MEQQTAQTTTVLEENTQEPECLRLLSLLSLITVAVDATLTRRHGALLDTLVE